ncbi:MAG: TonB-dependent receptor [marine benthic group bacterium]|nr:TonB-dependent receptor [Candidatus Benthicola marisminoris]
MLEPVVAQVARPTIIGSASGLTLDLDSALVAPALSLADMLRELPLVRVRDNSRGETHLTLRGAESRQVSISLDGIPLTIGWDNRTDLSVIPLSGATRLSAVRGLSSLLDGPNVLGGVVRIGLAPAVVPAAPESIMRPRAAYSSGAALAGDVAVQTGFGGAGRGGVVRVGGGVTSRDYLPVSASTPQPAYSEDGRRTNSDSRQWNAFVAGRLQGDAGWLGLSTLAFGAERGVAPELHVEEPRLWRLPLTRRWVTVLGGGTSWGSAGAGTGTLSLRGALDVGRFEIDEYDTAAYETVVERESGEDRTITLKADLSQKHGWGALAVSLTGAETRHDETLSEEGEARYRQRLLSGAAELAIPLRPGSGDAAFGLLLGASADASDTPESGRQEARGAIWDWGGKVAALLEIPGIGGRAHAGVSRRSRAPSLRELYSGALGRFVVNPELGPETLTAAEIGVTGGGRNWQWQAVGFHHRLTDGIVRTSAGSGQFRRANRDRVTTTGLELLGGGRWGAWLLDGDLVLQDPSISDSLAPTDEREPEYQPTLALNLEASRLLPASLVGRLRFSFVGRQYCVNPDLERDVELDEMAWAGVALERTWRLGTGPRARSFRVVGGIQNLTDASVYDQCGLPAPGRRFALTVSLG